MTAGFENPLGRFCFHCWNNQTLPDTAVSGRVAVHRHEGAYNQPHAESGRGDEMTNESLTRAVAICVGAGAFIGTGSLLQHLSVRIGVGPVEIGPAICELPAEPIILRLQRPGLGPPEGQTLTFSHSTT